jgi:hypothetical protein
MIYKILDKRINRTILFIVISLGFTLLNANKFFFWDSISQISIPANWYYDNNFRYFFVPDEYATGHPTFVGMYLAFLWKMLGKSLLVSHLAMFPFIFGILFQLDSYLIEAGKDKTIPFLIFIVVLCDSTLVSQMSMVTFDIPQFFFFLWCINCINKQRYLTLSVAFIALMITSLRGSLCGFGIILYGLINSYQRNQKLLIKAFMPFIPGLISLVIFLVSFYLQKHWIIHNTVSEKWEEFSKFASITGIFRNIGLVAWRLIDYGRIGIWIMLSIILFLSLKRKTHFDTFFKNTFYIAICQFIVIFPVVILYKNPFGHRYFLPVIIPVAIAVVYWILKYSKFRYVIYILIFLFILSGSFWVYPYKIAQGWDATPAHWPYYSVRNEMLDYLKTNNIPLSTVGSFFPNIASFKLTDLSEDNQSFKDADLEKEEYILFSNVYNQSDDIIDKLFLSNNWTIEKPIVKRGVFMILFRRVGQNYIKMK